MFMMTSAHGPLDKFNLLKNKIGCLSEKPKKPKKETKNEFGKASKKRRKCFTRKKSKHKVVYKFSFQKKAILLARFRI